MAATQVTFKYKIKQPVYFLSQGSIRRGFIVKQYYSNEIKEFDDIPEADNRDEEKYYMVRHYLEPYKSSRFDEESLFASREDFFIRMDESWNSL